VTELTKKIDDLKVAKPDSPEIATLEAEKKAARLTQLKEVDWQKLWGIPAIMAAVIFGIFMVAFREPASRSGATS
jgi:hypothetical protein